MTEITTAQVRRAVVASGWRDVDGPGFDAWLTARDARTQAARWAAACEAGDAATPAEKLEALYAAVEDTVRLLERAQLLPADFQHVAAPAWCETRIYAGDLRFVAGMTGSLDTPAVHYVVTSSTDVADVHGSERTTRDLNEVRAWLLSWAVQASQAAAGAA